MQDMLYVPSLSFNLLFLRELCKLGLCIEFDDSQVLFRNKLSNEVVYEGSEENGVYLLSNASSHIALSSSSSSPTFHLWHARFVHICTDYLRKATNMVIGFLVVGGLRSLCPSCIKGKNSIGNLFQNKQVGVLPNLLSLSTWIYVDPCSRFLEVGACILCPC